MVKILPNRVDSQDENQTLSVTEAVFQSNVFARITEATLSRPIEHT